MDPNKFSNITGLLILFFITAFIFPHSAIPSDVTIFRPTQLEPIQIMSQHKDWTRFKIFIWPYKTAILEDHDLYRELGITGFQIDKGANKRNLVEFSVKQNFPFYGGHVAGKGYLYLTGDNVRNVLGKKKWLSGPTAFPIP